MDYLTLRAEGRAAFTERRSRFLACAAPVADAEAAASFVAGVRESYRDATHNCWAWLVDGGHMRASDDGEPSGTAGTPMLEVLKKENLQKAAVVVTRYFGGVLLGAGGLVRAYSTAARLGVEAAGIVRMTPCRRFTLTAVYSDAGRIENALQQAGVQPENTVYTDSVTLVFSVESDRADALCAALKDLTAGRAALSEGEPVWLPRPI